MAVYDVLPKAECRKPLR